ncbi:MAG: 50S ribosomal protein L11 methyltransferase [Flavobacteriales bacterium]|nr:MAG: 50S ribosomal protein L11 methyltransferase [Flavobacteriales bacterium]
MEYIEFKANILPIEIGRDVLIAELSELGFESFVETNEGIEAYIQSEEFEESAIQSLKILTNPMFQVNYSIKKIADQNWNAEWEKNFNPIYVENRCSIRAPFHEKIAGIEYDIIIDPKMSFGTGHHETTYLMIKRLLDMELKNKKVLDMGCGTGVLAILAQMKKARYVKAIDVDEWAYNNTLENIRNNNCEQIEVKMGGAEKIEENNFDVVIANINRNILLNDMKRYVSSMIEGGELLLSGFFSSDKEILLVETSKLGLELLYSDSKNDWTMLHLIKR